MGYFKQSIFPIGSSHLLFPVLGYFIYHSTKVKEHKNKIYLLGFFSAIIHFYLTYYAVVYLGDSSRFLTIGEINSLIIASAVFLWFKEQNWEKIIHKLKITPHILQMVSSCSLGIYLIQALFFIASSKYDLGLTNPYCGAFITYSLALPVVAIMKKIPIVKLLVP